MMPADLSVDQAIDVYTRRQKFLTKVSLRWRSTMNAVGVHWLNRVIRETEDALDKLQRARSSELM